MATTIIKRECSANTPDTSTWVAAGRMDVSAEATGTTWPWRRRRCGGRPNSYKQAVHGSKVAFWQKGIDKELASHRKNRTWTLVPRSDATNILTSRWVVKNVATGRDLVVDVNAAPGWQAISEVTRVDVGALILREVVDGWSDRVAFVGIWGLPSGLRESLWLWYPRQILYFQSAENPHNMATSPLDDILVGWNICQGTHVRGHLFVRF